MNSDKGIIFKYKKGENLDEWSYDELFNVVS